MNSSNRPAAVDQAAVDQAAIDQDAWASESATLKRLVQLADLAPQDRADICKEATRLVQLIRQRARPGLMEVFLAEYGLSTDEGIALMCLAEALLRVPDAETIDALIEDKIAPSDWSRHIGHSSSPLVNASTWALMLTGKVLQHETPASHLRSAIRRLGEPVIRTAVARAMKEMGSQFVLGETIEAAMARAAAQERKGYLYSYDMLGEAALTDADARRYHQSYADAITAIAGACRHESVRDNPGISVKLSALHPRYEVAQQRQVMEVLVPRLRDLARAAKGAGMGLNVDAEEADRLALSLNVIEATLADPALAGWDGFGVVVQAYGQRASPVIDYLHGLAEKLDRRLMVRLVKGAYWDTEIKRAQVAGIDGFPVFTSRAATDVSYIANARKLLTLTARLYPQFATHNAHTAAAVLFMVQSMSQNPSQSMRPGESDYEFQRLHGMGEALHEILMNDRGTRCRIYAPVGAHQDLLAYLVRRLLENGANSSFVNQIVNLDVPAEQVASDPFDSDKPSSPDHLKKGPDLFAPARKNARGYDLAFHPTLKFIDEARQPYASHEWTALPILAGVPGVEIAPAPVAVTNPADLNDQPGRVMEADDQYIKVALENARPWAAPAEERAGVLHRIAELYESRTGELLALLSREAGKTLKDAVSEVREAVDFLYYYAACLAADQIAESEDASEPLGTVLCISPWNFPLAIFTGQVSAALAAGNGVLAKPAEQTPLIACLAVQIMHEAGVPRESLQFLPGDGGLGARLTADARIDGVAFTGSTQTARKIQASLAASLAPGAPLIAETGGLNAMIVDSTALPEQAVKAIVESAFLSAGQRCSALRCLYVHEDLAESLTAMLTGAMDQLNQGNPWELATDLGPVIDAEARTSITAYVEAARAEGRVIHEAPPPAQSAGTHPGIGPGIRKDAMGHFIAPCLIRVNSIANMEREIFGPILHLATFGADELGHIIDVIDAVNATGYGLTFGLMTRIDDRVQQVTELVRAGNIYVNRNQTGAVVGSQPFGGEGLSGTGPKAGGPHYLARFRRYPAPNVQGNWQQDADISRLQARLDETQAPVPAQTQAPAQTQTQTQAQASNAADGSSVPKPAASEIIMPGPTGESNKLSLHHRAPLLCLGPGTDVAARQVRAIQAHGGLAVASEGRVAPAQLPSLKGFSGLLWWGDAETARGYAQALAAREGPILPLITTMPDICHAFHERHVCVDTTAAGGNAALLISNAAAEEH